jgi:hypothetical protein
MKRLCLILALLFASVVEVSSAIIWVDKSLPANCSGTYSEILRNCTGSDGDAHTTIQGAFNNLSLGAGDIIQIVGPDIYSEIATMTRSGGAGNPIVIQAKPGTTPVLRNTSAQTLNGVINIRASHVTITGTLRFDGTGVQTSKHAILVDAVTAKANLTGITIGGIAGNGLVLDDWGGSGNNTQDVAAVSFRGTQTSGFSVTNSRIAHVTFSNNAHRDIVESFGFDNIHESNISTGLRCGAFGDGRVGVQGIKMGDDGSRPVVLNNRISAVSNNCAGITQTDANLVAAIYADTGVTFGRIEGNQVFSIAQPFIVQGLFGGDSAAIFIESRNDDWTVRNNLIYDVFKGVRVGSGGFSGTALASHPDRTKIHNNTIAKAEDAPIRVLQGSGHDIRNNILDCDNPCGRAVIEVAPDAVLGGVHTINFNILHCTNCSNVGRYNGSSGQNFATWKTSCNCDAQSQNPSAATSLFVNRSGDDYTQPDASIAKDLGAAISGIGCNGAACDIGAFEVPETTASQCIVGKIAANIIVCDFEVNRYGGGLISNTPVSGWTILRAGNLDAVVSATITLAQVKLTLTTNFAAGESCSVTYEEAVGDLRDNAPFTLQQSVLDFSGTCSNAVPAGGGGGSFPLVANSATTVISVTSTTHTINLPASISSGDLLICTSTFDPNTAMTAPSWPANWNTIVPFTKTTVQSGNAGEARYKIATGSEGSTIDVTTSTFFRRSAHFCYRITGWEGSDPPEGAIAVGDSTTPDPPNLGVSWGALNTLWIAVGIADGGSTFTADPASYGNVLTADTGSGASGAHIRGLTRNLNAASENPSAFTRTSTGSDHWVAMTIAIQPTAGAAVVPVRVGRPRVY